MNLCCPICHEDMTESSCASCAVDPDRRTLADLDQVLASLDDRLAQLCRATHDCIRGVPEK